MAPRLGRGVLALAALAATAEPMAARAASADTPGEALARSILDDLRTPSAELASALVNQVVGRLGPSRSISPDALRRAISEELARQDGTEVRELADRLSDGDLETLAKISASPSIRSMLRALVEVAEERGIARGTMLSGIEASLARQRSGGTPHAP